ncbi:MAG: tripartite tricarboxylate transporter substrate binding protein [Proteobacteria bacterium]|nr:tripartite tricarboxylate transporter substrate binding protein [Pseudomonadota bacterium]
MKRFKFLFSMVFLVCLGLTSLQVMAMDKWPTKQVSIVVPFSPGGTTDRVARALALFLEKELQVPVIIVNRKGGGGIVGTKAHLKNDPDDGSYLVYSLEPYLSAAVVNNAFEIDDFEYFGMTNRSPQGLWVNKKSKFQTANDLFNTLKNGKRVTTAVIPGGWSRAAVAIINDRLKSKAKQIPYQGGGAVQRMAMIKQETDFAVSEFYGTAAAAGEDLKCLGVFAESRLSDFPEVPTINEVLQQMNLKPIDPLYNFRFLMVKKSFRQKYPDRWKMMADAIAKAIQNQDYKAQMSKQNIKISWMNAAQTKNLIETTDAVLQTYSEYWKR